MRHLLPVDATRDIWLLSLPNGEKAPPKEVLIFPFSTHIRTLKGIFKFTRRSAQLVSDQWKKWGRQFGFDYEHSTFDKKVPPKDRDAAGWGDLVVRKTGLWCVNIEWSQEASKKIVAKGFRYTSPAFDDDKGEITKVINCALTNVPATLDAKPLLLSALSGIDTVPPEEVRQAAKRGLQLRKEHKQGGTAVGIARARDLSRGARLSPITVSRMVSFFARHSVDDRSKRDETDPSPAYIAWMLWGGDAGRDWASNVAARIEQARNRGPHELSSVPVAGGGSGGDVLQESQVNGEWGKNKLGAVPFKAYPKHEDESWDGDAAEKEMQHFAGVDQPAAPASAWKKYAHGFAYVSGKGDKLGDFHLPHHRVVDGKLVTSLKGIEAAGAAVQGAHGSTPDIPAADLPAVKRHLAAHYRQFGRTPPFTTLAHLPGTSIDLNSNPRNKMADIQNEKHETLAKKLHGHLLNTLAAAQQCSESDHPMLKELGADLAGSIPEHATALKEGFPEMGEPDEDDEKEEKASAKLSVLLSAVEKVTGVKTGHVGALLALKANADAGKDADSDLAKRQAKVDHLITKARKLHPSQREEYTLLSMEDLDAFEKNARVIGPKGPNRDIPTQQLSATAPPDEEIGEADVKAAQADALEVLRIDPKDPRLAKR